MSTLMCLPVCDELSEEHWQEEFLSLIRIVWQRVKWLKLYQRCNEKVLNYFYKTMILQKNLESWFIGYYYSRTSESEVVETVPKMQWEGGQLFLQNNDFTEEPWKLVHWLLLQ